MFNNYYFLKEYTSYLETHLKKAKIVSVFSQEKDKLVICFIKDNKKSFLEFSREKNNPYIILKEDFKKASKNVANLFNEIYGFEIIELSVLENERIIMFHLNIDLRLYFSFIPSKLNFFITKNDKILNTFKDKIELQSKNIQEYLKLKAKGNKISECRIVKDLFSKYYYSLGQLYIEEILYRLDIKEDELLTQTISKKIHSIVKELIEKFKEPDYYIYNIENKFVLSLAEIKKLVNYFFRKYDNINIAVKEYLILTEKSGMISTMKKEKLAKLNQQLKQKLNTQNNLLKQSESSSDCENYLKFGNTILSNLNNINKNDDELIFFDEEKGIYSEIPLKSGIPPAENANIYFSKYKKYKNSKNVLEKKLLSVNKEIEYLKNEIKMTEELEQIEKPKKENKKEQEDSYKNKFRIFKLDENNEVWVGKSSESNDLLTFKYSNPEDIWFHVRGFSGSHTVLRRNNKKENIDRKFLESAAAIAAYYSKARNAGTVPVAYCERKYVKKRKGFKQGTVIMEREKLIYTKPRLPGN